MRDGPDGPGDAPGILRRFAAMFYDTLLLAGVVFLAAGIAVAVHGGAAYRPNDPWFSTYLLGVCYLYFAWQWTHGGRTLGMACWRLRVVRMDGGPLSWRDATLRFVAAIAAWLPAGLGHAWAAVDGSRLAWHDRLSRTRLAMVPGPSAGKQVGSRASGDASHQEQSDTEREQGRE